MEDQILFIDCCTNSGFNLNLCESAGQGQATKFRGKFQEAEAVNKNKRMYPYEVLAENIHRLDEAIKDRRLVGELDHPQDSIIHFRDASHLITKLWWEGNTLMGEGEILDTVMGNCLKRIINNGVKVGISSRGVGNGKVNEDGILVIGESYKLITFDIVADPSTFAAFQEKIVPVNTDRPRSESADSSWRGKGQYSKSPMKNESSSIHKLNKELLIACLSGVITSQSSSK